jgi:hypothetical protein
VDVQHGSRGEPGMQLFPIDFVRVAKQATTGYISVFARLHLYPIALQFVEVHLSITPFWFGFSGVGAVSILHPASELR